MKKIVTKDSLIAMLNSSREKQIKVIGRALVVLLNRQVAEEKNTNTTKFDNGIGFTPGDAFHGSVTAKYFVKHRTLTDWMVDRWMKPSSNGTPRIAKYSRQLNEAANAKLK
jgi:hypothetical protein